MPLPLVTGVVGLVAGVVVSAVVLLSLRDDDSRPGATTPDGVAEALVGQLGSEEAAIRATLRAIDRGYVFEQISVAATEGELQPTGVLLDREGNEVEPANGSFEARYARISGSVSWVRAGVPASLPPRIDSLNDDLLEQDVEALNRLAAVGLLPSSDKSGAHNALLVLLYLSKAGYNEAEIFGVLAAPGTMVRFRGGELFVVRESERPGEFKVDCPDDRPNPLCAELEREEAAAVAASPEPAATPPAAPGATEVREAIVYSGQLSVPICGALESDHSIEATVIDGVLELALEAECYETSWVQDAASRAITCAYTLTIVASATGAISPSGEFSATGTSEQGAVDFHGATCKEFPYDGSNDITEPFNVSGIISGSQITGTLYDDASTGQPGLPFTLTRD